MKDFVSGSKTFGGFTFHGLYTMPDDVFFVIFDYYKKTKINLLDDYSEMVYLEWKYESETKRDYESELDFPKIKSSIKRLRKSDIFNDEWLNEKRCQLEYFEESWEEFNRQQSIKNQPRILACKYTSSKDIKEKVFSIYGKKCLCCGSEKDITIDHVNPIVCGGKNTIKNLQPLCRSCNSKKGIKKIDYRKEYKNG